MILLACTVCARMKYIQYKDNLYKGAGSQRPQIGPVSQNRKDLSACTTFLLLEVISSI